MNILVSVIVPIYRVEEYLSRCVDSIIQQTYSNLEIILVDDGSPDASGNISDEYAKRDSRIKVIHKENGGLVSARKAGVEKATGTYITFVDGDDWLKNDFYENMVQCITSEKIDMVCAGFTQCFEDKNVECRNNIPDGLYIREEIESSIFPQMLNIEGAYQTGIISAVWNKLFKRELIEKNIYSIDERVTLGEDVICTYSCIQNAKSIVVSNDIVGYCYFYNQAAMTKKFDKRYLYHAECLFRELDRIFDNECSNFVSQKTKYAIHIILIGAQREISNRRFHLLSQWKYYKILIHNPIFYHWISCYQADELILTKSEYHFLNLIYEKKIIRAMFFQLLPKRITDK